MGLGRRAPYAAAAVLIIGVGLPTRLPLLPLPLGTRQATGLRAVGRDGLLSRANGLAASATGADGRRCGSDRSRCRIQPALARESARRIPSHDDRSAVDRSFFLVA